MKLYHLIPEKRIPRIFMPKNGKCRVRPNVKMFSDESKINLQIC